MLTASRLVVFEGDALRLNYLIDDGHPADFVFTCPPYADPSGCDNGHTKVVAAGAEKAAAAPETPRSPSSPGLERILHWSYPPYTHAYCGKPRDRELKYGGVDGEFCVVCSELRELRRHGKWTP